SGSLLAGPVGSDDDRATWAEEDLAAEEDAQVAAVSAATAGPLDGGAAGLFAREQELLDQMTEVADAARALPDARVLRLIAWIRANMCPDLPQPGARPSAPAKWNNTRVLIFTEYDDTKRYLLEKLQTAIQHTEHTEQRIAVFHGPTPDDQREEIKQAFNADPATHPLRILLATDAAREGLNLQAHCSNLFHFDVPWNPSRMEQRNGRIDRKLQPSDVVRCHYFFYRQRAEDRILAALVRKTETIRKELGSLAQVIDTRLTDKLKQGIRHGDIDTMERDIETADLDPARRSVVDEELEANRERHTELRQQIDRLRTALEESQAQIGLRQEHFQAAISCALHLVGGEPLATLPSDGRPKDCQQTECLAFPALDQRKSDWASTLDALRAPRPRGQKLWEWRN
ncbi:MAG TPA: helicase-related protein, partial [Pirellulaceae bacterium]|nr:helicase-related protein [Pirellulaceae bacterium]